MNGELYSPIRVQYFVNGDQRSRNKKISCPQSAGVHTSKKDNEKSKSSIIHIPATNDQKMNCRQKPVEIRGEYDNPTSWVTYQQSSRYLGAIINSTLTDDEEIRSRIDKTVSLFGSMRKI